MVDVLKVAETLSSQLDTTAPHLARLDKYYDAEQAASFLSQEAREALGKQFRQLAVNYPRVAVDSVGERLTPTGFRLEGPDSKPDEALWKVWQDNGMEEQAAQAHTEALALGRSFVIVWAGSAGKPLVTVESARQVAVYRNPGTREVEAAFKRWLADGKAHAVVYTPANVVRLVSRGHVPSEGSIPASGWEIVETLDNPLGVVPVVPIVNRGRLMDLDGQSEMQDILGLADALNKISTDMMVTSEHYARPRRWATGLEVVEDEETGEPINPFGSEANRVWQSEDPATKFGQFEGSRLDGYGDAIRTLTQQIGALSGLPAHYLGLNGDQPPSADSIRSAESPLVAKALARQRSYGAAWAKVAALIIAVRDGVDPRTVEVETVWASPETRTPAQSADAAAKLHGMGFPLAFIAETTLGYSPAQIDRMRELKRAEALDTRGVDLTGILP
ncbi:hypothetical protein GCM10027063_40480 [Promicromonospora xylanilytica]